MKKTDRFYCSVYCTACLKYLIYPDEYHDVLLEDPWKCLLCKMDNVSTSNGVILPRLEWKEQFAHMFRTNPNSKMKLPLDYNWKKRKMRVLSLFDGLATGNYVRSKATMTLILQLILQIIVFFLRLVGTSQIGYNN